MLETAQIEHLLEENKRLKSAEKYLRVINEFSASIASLYSTEQLVWTIAKHVIAELDFVDCVIYLKADDDKNLLVQRAAYGPKNPEAYEIKNPIVIQIGEGIVGSAAKTGLIECISDTRKDPRYIFDDELRLSELAVPIQFEGRILGVIDSEHPEVGFFTQQHVDILLTLASLVAPRIAFIQEHSRSLKAKNEELQQTLEQLTAANIELKVAKESADQMSRAKTEFIHKVSHELRTPLNAILGYGAIVREDLEAQDPNLLLLEDLDRIDYAARHLLQIINDILDVAKIETKSMSLVIESEPLEKIIVDVRMTVQILARQNQNRFIVEFDDLFREMITDGQKVRQILINLLSNAFKFTKNGTVSLKVFSKITPNNVITYFEITDTGVGISAEFLDELFVPFHQEDNSLSRLYKGTGLGLAISKQFAQILGGDIFVKSEVGVGSTFTFWMPTICPNA